MSLTEYFEKHEEQAFVAKALATAVAIILVKNYLSGLITFLLLIFPLVFLLFIRMHAAAEGVSAMDVLRENITFLPLIRSENERRTEVKPWMTYGIIAANVLIFYCFELNVSPEFITDNLVFLPHKPDFVNVPLSAFTSLFLHGSGMHLWGNMTFLWVVGTAVERRVGWIKFTWLYLLTGIIGGLVFIMVEYVFHGTAGHALGASGAIAGIMGVFAVRCYFKSMIFPLPILGIFSLILPISLKIRLNSLVIMALFFLSDLSGGIGQITGQSSSMIGHWAHLGGMITGMLLAGFLKLGEEAVEERHLEIGIKASEASVGYEEGVRSLQIALERSPENIDALLGMARLRTKFRNTPEGRDLYEKVLGLMVKERPAGMTEVFREFFNKYHAVPRDAMLVWNMAEALRKEGDTDLCIRCLECLVEMPDTASHVREKALYQLATLLEYTSCFEAAQSCFARFVTEYPDSILAEKAREQAGDQVCTPPRAAVAEVETRQTKNCPSCGAWMRKLPAKSGPNRGKLYWVCGSYPTCKEFHPAEAPAEAPVTKVIEPSRQPGRYRLVFDGSINLSADALETRDKLASLFRCDRDRIDKLFLGKPTVLKRDLDHASALKMKEAFERTGAICIMQTDEAPATAAKSSASELKKPAAATLRSVAEAPAAPPERHDLKCPKCGHLQKKEESCINCGVIFAKLAKIAERDFHSFHDYLPGGAARQPAMSESVERNWAMMCHLMVFSCILIPFGNLLGPLTIWLWKRKKSEFIDYHGKAALNFQLTLVLFMIASSAVIFFTGGLAIRSFVVVFTIFGIYSLFVIISSAVKAHKGDYPEVALSAHFIR